MIRPYKTKEQKFDERVERECRWHKWFAWYPVIVVRNGQLFKVWLRTVGRKRKVGTTIGDYYQSEPCIINDKYCFVDDVVAEALKDNSVVNKCDDDTHWPRGGHPPPMPPCKPPKAPSAPPTRRVSP